MAFLSASCALLPACHKAEHTQTKKDDGRAVGSMVQVLSAAESGTGTPVIQYEATHWKGELVVTLRFQVPEGTELRTWISTDYATHVVLGPPQKSYRFYTPALFSRAAEYQKTRYHRLEDFEVSTMPEIPPLGELPPFPEPGK